MYIAMTQADLAVDVQDHAQAEIERVHEFVRQMPGFRWAMYLHSLDEPDRFASVSMWLTPEQASSQIGAVLGDAAQTRGYDVVTARGAMTPASHLALVEWRVGEADAAAFANRWNAVFHAIEDRIGSRLLRDLEAPGSLAGLHAVTAEGNLDAKTLGANIEDGELRVSPLSVHRYEVLSLAEV